MSTNNPISAFHGFSKLNQEQRFQYLLNSGILTADDLAFLKQGGLLNLNLANQWIENAIGYFPLSLGLATHFIIDQKAYLIPLAVEETSIIAALSKTAKWIQEQGEILTSQIGSAIIGQIQCASVKSPQAFKDRFKQHKKDLLKKVNSDVLASMVSRGGGAVDLELRQLPRPDGKMMMIIHLLMDPCDAMGANIMNQALEYLKVHIEALMQETVNMCILSNLNDRKLTQATVSLRDIDADLGYRIQEASLFAVLDPYRAATSNKGVMNGIDPILIATGNDWRAVEAGLHAYAARQGRYQSITQWSYQEESKTLVGRLVAPIVLGIVGGVTALHPTAKLSLRIMNIQSASELSRIVAAVGLVQNLAAIRALTTEGITKGHMKLHINNLLIAAGADEIEIKNLKPQLESLLSLNKRITQTDVLEKLNLFRKESLKA